MTAQVHLALLGDGVYRLTLDHAGAPPNVLDSALLDSLRLRFDALCGDTRMRGLLIDSAHPGVFSPGELTAERILAADYTSSAIQAVQDIVLRLAQLPAPSVALIDGDCFGLGLELAMACTYRVCSASKESKLGLPDTQLGLLPYAGGAYLLPRLVGLATAIRLLRTGMLLDADAALACGLADRCVPRLLLQQTGSALALHPPPRRRGHPDNRLFAMVATQFRALRDIDQGDGVHYPSQSRAVELASRGLRGSMEQSFRREEAVCRELAAGPVAANLARIALRRQRAEQLLATPSELFDAASGRVPRRMAVRLRLPVLLESAWMLKEGISAAEIGRALRELGMAEDPIAVAMDWSGGDIGGLVERVARELGPRMEPPPQVAARLAEAGAIFGSASRRRMARRRTRRGTSIRDLRERFLLLWISEAARILEEGPHRSPEDIDLAAVLGAGFPGFLGGPLRQADELGLSLVVDSLSVFSQTIGPRYAPCELLQAMVIEDRSFFPDRAVRRAGVAGKSTR